MKKRFIKGLVELKERKNYAVQEKNASISRNIKDDQRNLKIVRLI